MIIENKKNIRHQVREVRNLLSKEEVEIRSQEINQNFLTNLLPKIYQKNSNQIFSIYLPSKNEVGTKLIAEFFNKNNIKYSYPKIFDKNQPLKFILSHTNQAFAANKFYPTILEPVSGVEILPNILILPLIAFDYKMHRIGSGGGFFDRTIDFLKKQNPEIIKIGLAYDFQGLSTDIITEKTDQELDFIVTSSNIFFLESMNS